RALERDAGARFQTATEFGRALSGALDRMASPAPRTLDPAAPPLSAGISPQAALPVTRVGVDRPAPTLTPVRRGGRALAYGAGGVTLLGALIGTAMLVKGGNNSPSAPVSDSVTPAGQPPSD